MTFSFFLLLLLFSTTSVADRLENVNTVASHVAAIHRRSRDEQPRALVLPVKNNLDLLLLLFFFVGAGAGLCRLA